MPPFDLLTDPAFWQDPGRACQPLLAQGCVHLPCALGGHAILGHQALRELAHDPRAEGVALPHNGPPTAWDRLIGAGLFTRQGADHAGPRAAASAGMTAMPERAAEVAARLLPGLLDHTRPRPDLSDDLARPLMQAVWGDLTGLPLPLLAVAGPALAARSSFAPEPGVDGPAEDAAQAVLEAAAVAALGDAPLVRALDGPPERIAEAIAGMTIDALETGGSGLAGALWHLLRHGPDRPTAPRALDEALRRAAPAPATMRQATADIPLPGGGVVATGDWLWMIWAAGDHDPAVHNDPMAFCPERARRPLLAFGGGAHGCLGRGIVRAVLAEVAGRLMSDGWRLAPCDLRFAPFVARYPLGAQLVR